jgi:tetratricopeptide (TPR) repeat protein
MRRPIPRFSLVIAVVVCAAFGLRADTTVDAELQLQLASLLADETRYREAIDAYDRVLAAVPSDPVLAVPARKGKIRAALRIGEFMLAKSEAITLRDAAPRDADALALYGDALWSAGLFDDADIAYRDAIDIAPDASRAHFGLARSLAATSRLDEALNNALAASAASPRDGEIYGLIAEIHERSKRFDEAANAYTNYINLLPNKDRSEKAEWSRSKVEFLRSFEGVNPVDVDEEDLNMLHTLPFRLVRDKIIVQGRVDGMKPMDFVLDTGSEETVISRETAQRARVRPVAYTLSAGVGEVGLRGLQLGQI